MNRLRRLIGSVILVVITMGAFLVYQRRQQELELQETLQLMRATIDTFTVENNRRPQAPLELLTRGYLKQMPVDPITRRADTWIFVESHDARRPGVADVRSGAKGRSLLGSRFEKW